MKKKSKEEKKPQATGAGSEPTLSISMTLRHRKILHYIRFRPRKKAVKNSTLVKLTGYHEREVRELVRELVMIYQQPIGSSTSEGYWWISNPTDAAEIYDRLRGRAMKILQRAAAIRGIGMDQVVQQLELDLK